MKDKEELKCQCSGDKLSQVAGGLPLKGDGDCIEHRPKGLYCPLCGYYIGNSLIDNDKGLMRCPSCGEWIRPEFR